MSPLSIRCIKAAFLALAAGILLGAAFAFDRGLGAQLRPLHAELNLWGWVTLLIYGMGYHMLPRFSGRPLRRPRLANQQSWLAIAGVAMASLGWLLRPGTALAGQILLTLGGIAQLIAALLFALLIGDLLRPAERSARA
jgi:heme/copper-type cytochrome/quinol oxidase subunit 1